MPPAKVTAIDRVLARLDKLGIYADDSDYPGEWFVLWSDSYADDQLYKRLSAQWPSIVSGYWGYFALVYCELGYEGSYQDSGVWLHYLLDESGHVRNEYAVGASCIHTW